nr:RecName: Full=Dioicin-1; AltName: Full=Ribosome-inactivating protein; AltName: Full=rRNA N-glycosidase [Phytolacca dioica]
ANIVFDVESATTGTYSTFLTSF